MNLVAMGDTTGLMETQPHRKCFESESVQWEGVCRWEIPSVCRLKDEEYRILSSNYSRNSTVNVSYLWL